MIEKQKIYLIVGVPGSGKSWVCRQLENKFRYVRNDDYMKIPLYLDAIKSHAQTAKMPVLAEAPFSVNQIKEPLEADGYVVEPVFIIEADDIVSDRYMRREGREIPKGHITRMATYRQRATDWGSFQGTSSDVFHHLNNIALKELF